MVLLEIGTTEPNYAEAVWPEDDPWINVLLGIPLDGRDICRITFRYDSGSGFFTCTMKLASGSWDPARVEWLRTAQETNEAWLAIMYDMSSVISVDVAIAAIQHYATYHLTPT